MSRCVTCEDKVASFGLVVAGEAGIHKRLVARFAVFEVSEPPAARRGVLFGFLDHELNVRGGAGNERLGSAKDLVVFLRRDVTVVQSGNDRAVREWELPLAVGFDRYIVTQNSRKTVEVAFFVCDRNQPLVAISRRDSHSIARGGLCIGLSRCGCPEGDNAAQCCKCDQQESDPFHKNGSSFKSAYQSSRPAFGLKSWFIAG